MSGDGQDQEPPDFLETLSAKWTPEEWAENQRIMEEAEASCVRCGRAILAGCKDPQCGIAR